VGLFIPFFIRLILDFISTVVFRVRRFLFFFIFLVNLFLQGVRNCIQRFASLAMVLNRGDAVIYINKFFCISLQQTVFLRFLANY